MRPARILRLRGLPLVIVAALCVLVTQVVAAPNATAAVAVCVVRAHQPHPSGHFAGRINAVGGVSCVGDPILDLRLDVQLQQKLMGKWHTIRSRETLLASDLMFRETSRSISCRSGRFRTRARIFANGRNHAWARSAARVIECTSGGGAGGGGGGGW
jgi:hypothetical protein